MYRCRMCGTKKGWIKGGLPVGLLVMLMLMTSGSRVCAAEQISVSESSVLAEKRVQKLVNGWKTVNGKTYYYLNGKKVKGWKNIKGKVYHFTKTGELQKNMILYNSGKRCYQYVDSTGVRVTNPVITAAVNFVVNHSSSQQTRFQRLNACFQALCAYPYQRFYGDEPSARKISSYASYMFTNRQGNCYRYAAAMAYIARVLGYDSRVAIGGVTSRTYGPLSPHGWCEIKIGKRWMVYDCSMQSAWNGVKLHNVKRSEYPFRLRCDAVYLMNSQNGKISWK
ncbi:MAG: transglutaminase domain-containing protein [Candidatus Limivivens sp.]|nr:transglutaminase domain-containing protein [Candidatus Limivivens sp.]